jgi:hypothetical protein
VTIAPLGFAGDRVARSARRSSYRETTTPRLPGTVNSVAAFAAISLLGLTLSVLAPSGRPAPRSGAGNAAAKRLFRPSGSRIGSGDPSTRHCGLRTCSANAPVVAGYAWRQRHRCWLRWWRRFCKRGDGRIRPSPRRRAAPRRTTPPPSSPVREAVHAGARSVIALTIGTARGATQSQGNLGRRGSLGPPAIAPRLGDPLHDARADSLRFRIFGASLPGCSGWDLSVSPVPPPAGFFRRSCRATAAGARLQPSASIYSPSPPAQVSGLVGGILLDCSPGVRGVGLVPVPVDVGPSPCLLAARRPRSVWLRGSSIVGRTSAPPR